MMQPPMIGSWTVVVKAVRPFSIHGDLYYDLHAVRSNDPSAQPISVKLPRHAISVEPQAGQTILVKFLMGQATEARVVVDAGPKQQLEHDGLKTEG